MTLFEILKKPVYFLTALGISFLAFDFYYYLMAKLPGNFHESCMIGANLTPLNVFFSILLSVLTGVLVVGLAALFAKKSRQKKLAIGSISGLALLIGTFTVFCTICSLSVISLFGLSISLAAFTNYNLLFKVISLVLTGLAVWLVNRQLKGGCICR